MGLFYKSNHLDRSIPSWTGTLYFKILSHIAIMNNLKQYGFALYNKRKELCTLLIRSDRRAEGHCENWLIPSCYWKEYQEKTWVPSHYEYGISNSNLNQRKEEDTTNAFLS
jgi:hypothetical protein